MDKIAAVICEIMADYHKDNNFKFCAEHVIKWTSQFGEDGQFILEEFYHILEKGIYVSEKKAKSLLVCRVEMLAKKYKYKDVIEFIANAEFPLFQEEGKSQDVLLKLLGTGLQETFGIGLAAAGQVSKKHTIYIDDILATGGTVYRLSSEWLTRIDENGVSNLKKIIIGEKTYDVCVFCSHTRNTFRWRLKIDLKEDLLLKKIGLLSDYAIEDHRSFLDQKMNFAFPIRDEAEPVFDAYLKSLDKDGWVMNDIGAYRDPNQPKKEVFFSSFENRKRFEHILLRKGIEILTATATLAESQRPLGMTFPSHRSFGSGTLFFTWRNISNTCPVVFWWDKGGWLPLFPLVNRGLKN